MKKFAMIVASAMVFSALALVFSVPASADTLSDQLTVYDANGGVYAQLSVYDSGAFSFSGTDSNTSVGCMDANTMGSCAAGSEDPYGIYFLGDPNLGNSTQLDPTTLCEDAACTQYSDAFGLAGITPESSTYYLAFNSDNEIMGAQLAGGPGPSVLETGAPVYATQYLSSSLQEQGFTATFQSDLDAAVPEPGTLPLLATGLIGLALLGTFKRKLFCNN